MPRIITIYAILWALQQLLQTRSNGLIVAIGLVTLMVSPSLALPAYDCSHPQLSGSYSLLAIKKCREANPDVIQTTEENYYVYEGI